MESVIICNICGKPFEATGVMKICQSCFEQDMNDFNRIRDYLCLHPRAKVFDVSTNLGIPILKIKRFLKECRLEIVEKDNSFLRCEDCGKPICSGVQCDDCRQHSPHDYQVSYTGNTSGKGKINYLPSQKKH